MSVDFGGKFAAAVCLRRSMIPYVRLSLARRRFPAAASRMRFCTVAAHGSPGMAAWATLSNQHADRQHRMVVAVAALAEGVNAVEKNIG